MAPCKEKNELRHTATRDNGRVLDVAVESVSRHTATEWNAARHTATEKKESWHNATGGRRGVNSCLEVKKIPTEKVHVFSDRASLVHLKGGNRLSTLPRGALLCCAHPEWVGGWVGGIRDCRLLWRVFFDSQVVSRRPVTSSLMTKWSMGVAVV